MFLLVIKEKRWQRKRSSFKELCLQNWECLHREDHLNIVVHRDLQVNIFQTYKRLISYKSFSHTSQLWLTHKLSATQCPYWNLCVCLKFLLLLDLMYWMDWGCSSDCLQSIFICEWVLTNIHFILVSNIKKNYQWVVKGYITTRWLINVGKELFRKRHLKGEYEFDEGIKAERWCLFFKRVK